MGTILNKFIIISAIYHILVIHFSPSICSAKKVSAIFAFGDSLFEVGNNFYIKTLAKPTLPNGEELGFTNYTLPYLSPKTTGDVILKGVNYASSGSGIFNSTGEIYGDHISMDEQTDYFAKTRQEIISKIGSAAARKLLRHALYFIAAGANDIFIRSRNFSAPDEDAIISRFRSQLTNLYNLDARKIAVTNVAPLGCTPNQRDKYSTDDCVERVNELAKSYNRKLKILLSKLPRFLPGSKFVCVDTYAALDNILQNYKSYGFENADSACCRVRGKHGGEVPCVFYARFCPDRTKYVFWDAYHPAENANLIAAKFVLDGDRKYVSPMNIRRLANS
ncbi:hypothetical protein REPUB_Repub14bG0090100 [Reevesia pubescens]